MFKKKEKNNLNKKPLEVPPLNLSDTYYPALKPANLETYENDPKNFGKKHLPDFDDFEIPSEFKKDSQKNYSDNDDFSHIKKTVDDIENKFKNPNTPIEIDMEIPTPSISLQNAVNTHKIRQLEDEYLKIRPEKEEITIEELKIEEKKTKKTHKFILVDDYRLILEDLAKIKKEFQRINEMTQNYDGFLSRHETMHNDFEKNVEALQRDLILMDTILYGGYGE